MVHIRGSNSRPLPAPFSEGAGPYEFAFAVGLQYNHTARGRVHVKTIRLRDGGMPLMATLEFGPQTTSAQVWDALQRNLDIHASATSATMLFQEGSYHVSQLILAQNNIDIPEDNNLLSNYVSLSGEPQQLHMYVTVPKAFGWSAGLCCGDRRGCW